jgi:hypothetical protein
MHLVLNARREKFLQKVANQLKAEVLFGDTCLPNVPDNCLGLLYDQTPDNP